MKDEMLSLPAISSRKFTNPLSISVRRSPKGLTPYVNPDPYVIKFNGEYYCYSTGYAGANVLKSTDLVNWTHLGFALSVPNQTDYWAPSVIYHNGLFYMYYSSNLYGEEPASDDSYYEPGLGYLQHFEFMKVAVSEKPEGPFEYKCCLFDHFSIDSHVVKDENENFYIFYCVDNYNGNEDDRAGTVILVDKLIDMFTPSGNPALVVKPTLDEEIHNQHGSGNTRDWHTVEGPFYLKHRNKDYVIYSGSAFHRESYFLGYSVGEGAGDLTSKTWHKSHGDYVWWPILKKNSFVEGTGHNSVVKAPNNFDLWCIYHGREVKNSDVDVKEERRSMRGDMIVWNNDEICLFAPSSTEVDAPMMPSIRQLFFEKDLTGWNIQNGKWEAGGGQLTQKDSRVNAEITLDGRFKDFIYEVNLKWMPNNYGGSYGIIARRDECNYIKIMLDTGKRKVFFIEAINSIIFKREYKLKKDFNFKGYSQLILEKCGSLCSVFLNEIPVGNITFEGDVKLGLATQNTGACFAGVSVTNCFKMNSQNIKEFVRNYIFAAKPENKINCEDGVIILNNSSINIKMYENCRFLMDIKAMYPNGNNEISVSIGDLNIDVDCKDSFQTVHMLRLNEKMYVFKDKELIYNGRSIKGDFNISGKLLVKNIEMVECGG